MEYDAEDHHWHLKPTPTPASYEAALGFEQSVFGSHGRHLDGPSKVWIPIAVIYTFIVGFGMTTLFFQRFTHTARIRGYWLSSTSVIALHVYLTMILIEYPIRFWYVCAAEFWVMALIFPVGLGLYQLSNSRIISYYQSQQELLVMPKRNKKGRIPIWYTHPRAFLRYHKNMDFADKTRVFVYSTWCFAIFGCTLMYIGSINFHRGYGFFGEWSGKANCHRGPHGEWVPTAISQLLICWIWGPYTLWYARSIQDSHYWSIQTKINLIAGMPGTPLWMAFLYSNNPTVIAINRWFPHTGWFIPGIMTIQMGSIIFPLLDICRSPVYMAAVEGEHELNNLSSTTNALNQKFNKALTSMAAFENALENNVRPLLVWAANRNFTAADINFLVFVRNWKNHWGGPGRRNRVLTPNQACQRFEDAAVIFFTFINPTTSKVTVNIGDVTYRTISKYFVDVMPHDLSGEGTSFFSAQQQVAPWEKDEHTLQSPGVDGFDRARLHYVGADENHDDYDAIPKGFSLSVFDDAYNVIRDDIFYNTWLRYVNDLDTSSDATGPSDHKCTEACKHDSSTPSPLSELPEAHMRAARSPAT